MNNETFTGPKEQLDLITSIMQDSRTELRENSFPFLVWGGVSAAGTLLSYILGYRGLYAYIIPLWILIAAAAQGAIVLYYKKRQSPSVKYVSSRINSMLWTGILGFGIALAVVAGVFKTGFTLAEGLMVLSLGIGLGYLVLSVLSGYRILLALGILWAAGGLACIVVPSFWAPAVIGSMALLFEFIPGVIMYLHEKK